MSTRHSTTHETSRGFAKLLIASRKARKIGQNRLELICNDTWREIKMRFRGELIETKRGPVYIPAEMPPINVPNTFFQLPQSPQWKLQHRNFEQMVASLAQ